MSRTLLLAQHPFRDVISRALLLPLGNADAPLLVMTDSSRAPAGFAPVPHDADPATLGLSRVVIAGAFTERRELERALAAATLAVQAGATLTLESFALEGQAGQRSLPRGVAVLDQAAAIRARDHRTINGLTLWRVAAAFTLAPYPERAITPDPTLAAQLPAGPILGVAIRHGEEMRASWAARTGALRRLLAPAQGWPVLPLPVQGPGTPGDDWAGTSAFVQAMLPGATLLLPELADFKTWRRMVSPARLRGLVSRCAWVVTNRDLPAAFAVAEGVRVTGIALGSDRRIVSCLATLGNALPPGSDLVHPAPDKPSVEKPAP